MRHVLKNDTVEVIAGEDRGKTGRVLEVIPEKNRALVEHVNMVKRHTRPRPIRDASRMGGTQMTPGGVIEKPAPLPISNVMLVCPTCGLPTRIGYKFKDVKGETVKVRVCKREGCGEELDR